MKKPMQKYALYLCYATYIEKNFHRFALFNIVNIHIYM